MKYSIIIPHYNIPELLVRCLRSIPQRDDVQVIVVDDGSPEADQYVARYPELSAPGVEFYTVAHRGLAGVMRNIGLGYAKGEWVMFVDADDLLTEHADAVFSLARAEGVDMFFYSTNALMCDDLSQPSCRNHSQHYFDEYASSHDERALRYQYGPLWGKVIRRDMLTTNHIQFEATAYSNDLFFSAQCGVYARQVQVENVPLYIVTERSGSLASSQFADNPSRDECLTRLKVTWRVHQYYRHRGIDAAYYKPYYHFKVLRKHYKLDYYRYLIYFCFAYPSMAYYFIKCDLHYIYDKLFNHHTAL